MRPSRHLQPGVEQARRRRRHEDALLDPEDRLADLQAVEQEARERPRRHAGGGFLGDCVARREHASGGIPVRRPGIGREHVIADQIQAFADFMNEVEVRLDRREDAAVADADQHEAVTGIDHNRGGARIDPVRIEAQGRQNLRL